MVRLGITGGIGSGKSYVSRLLYENFHIPVYNCDIQARVITLTDVEVIEALTQLLPDVYDEDGDIRRDVLADYLFASAENAQRINSIIHPAVRKDLHRWYSMYASEPFVAMESAILFESHFEDEVDKVVFVDAPLEVRISRVKERDGLTREQVLSRMAQQSPDEARQHADYIVMNVGQSPLIPQLDKLLNCKL